MTAQLNTQTVTTTFNSATVPYQSGGGFKFEIPQSSVLVVKPLTYNFRVVEYMDKKGAIAKVGLQYQIWEHDNYGVGHVIQNWTDVERVKLQIQDE
jgi:hypothetical protein